MNFLFISYKIISIAHSSIQICAWSYRFLRKHIILAEWRANIPVDEAASDNPTKTKSKILTFSNSIWLFLFNMQWTNLWKISLNVQLYIEFHWIQFPMTAKHLINFDALLWSLAHFVCSAQIAALTCSPLLFPVTREEFNVGFWLICSLDVSKICLILTSWCLHSLI